MVAALASFASFHPCCYRRAIVILWIPDCLAILHVAAVPFPIERLAIVLVAFVLPIGLAVPVGLAVLAGLVGLFGPAHFVDPSLERGSSCAIVFLALDPVAAMLVVVEPVAVCLVAVGVPGIAGPDSRLHLDFEC